MMKSILFLCLLGLVYCELDVQIQLSSAKYALGDELIVNWQLSSSNTVGDRILSWNTPLEGEFNANFFRIVNVASGKSAIYDGKLMKRAAPELEHFQLVTSTSGSMVLSDGYRFVEHGDYTVSLVFYAHFLNGEFAMVESNAVTFTVTTVDTIHPIISNLVGHSRDVGYTGCSTSEQSTVRTAISNAVIASNNTVYYMDQPSVNRCEDTFETWFGTYTTSHWNTIQSDFQAIYARLADNGFNIDCTCNQPGTYAFVYPSDPTHTIHLCPVFWDASSNKYSYNSQPGTLTHEMSHFTDVAGTDDIQYGVPGCIELAQEHPDRAVKNADSHEFLQESNPYYTC